MIPKVEEALVPRASSIFSASRFLASEALDHSRVVLLRRNRIN